MAVGILSVVKGCQFSQFCRKVSILTCPYYYIYRVYVYTPIFNFVVLLAWFCNVVITVYIKNTAKFTRKFQFFSCDKVCFYIS